MLNYQRVPIDIPVEYPLNRPGIAPPKAGPPEGLLQDAGNSLGSIKTGLCHGIHSMFLMTILCIIIRYYMLIYVVYGLQVSWHLSTLPWVKLRRNPEISTKSCIWTLKDFVVSVWELMVTKSTYSTAIQDGRPKSRGQGAASFAPGPQSHTRRWGSAASCSSDRGAENGRADGWLGKFKGAKVKLLIDLWSKRL